jgi:arylsulfatase A-like enzyme
MPTLLKLTGHSSTGQLPYDGQDIWPLLSAGKQPPAPRTLYFKRGNKFALRHGDWKLVTGGKEMQELFHLTVDPGEEKDLSRQNPEQAAKLRALLEQERKNDRSRS